MRNPTEGNPRRPNLATIEVQQRGHAHQRKCVTRPIANLQIMRPRREWDGRQIDRGDQFIARQIRVAIRSIAGQTMKIGKWNFALSIRSLHTHDSVESSHRHAHVTWMRRDALVALSENAWMALDPLSRPQATPGFRLLPGGKAGT